MNEESRKFQMTTELKYCPNGQHQKFFNNTEYFNALEKWFQNLYLWHSFLATFPYAMMSNHIASISVVNRHSNESVFPHMSENIHLQNLRTPTVRPVRPHAPLHEGGIEYRIPPLWKRFIAEFLDFLILFLLKLAVTFVAVDFFDFIDLDKYDLDVLQPNVKIDYKMAVEMTSEILLLELIHRIVVCFFETFWLQRGIGGRIGGATPGKTVMGIRVVLCTKVTPIEGRPIDVIAVYPGTDLGLGWAFARSFMKNVVLAVLFPICFALFFFRHNRTGYDIVSRTIVVEDPPRQQHRQVEF